MPSSVLFSAYAQTALAAYAPGLASDQDNTDRYVDPDMMSSAQATQFNAGWNVLQQSTPNSNGLSAVLLQNRASGEKVLSIAGTDPSSGMDLFADADIALFGTVLGMPQYVSLDLFYQQLVSTGKLGASEQVVVTGHSLGGFLAQAFTARHASVVSSAYTYNAPGFGTLETLLGFFGVTDTSAAAKITNVHAIDGDSVVAGLGILLGASQGVRIEPGVLASENHSIVKLGDALAVYEPFARLQPALSASQIEAQLLGAGYRDRRLEDALDALRTVFIGSASNDVNKTLTDDRDRLYFNLHSLQNDSGFKSLSGQVSLIEAGAGFASSAQGANGAALADRYALVEFLPFSVRASTEAQNQTLYGSYTQRLSLYDEATGQGVLTNRWLNDRADMLAWLVTRNRLNEEVFSAPGTQGMHYKDLVSATEFDVGLPDNVVEKRQTVFGGDAAESMSGKKLEDRLFGGAGNDTLNGRGGNDRLEGGTGTDSYEFDGAFGTDTVLDTGGEGVLKFDGSVLSGTLQRIKGLASVWEDATGLYVFVWKPGANGRGDLVIGKRTSPTDSKLTGVINVRNFANGELGLLLTDTERPAPASAAAGGIQVYFSDPLIPGTTTFGSATPDYQTVGVRDYTDLAAVAHWVHAPGDGGQIIALGSGDDYVAIARPDYDPNGQPWLPGPGQDEDYVSTGGGNDTVRTGYGADRIGAGAGDDWIFAGAYDFYQNHDIADSAGGDVVDAGDGVDNVYGSMGSDILFGGDGADGLLGMEGSDLLIGGDGNDGINGDGVYASDWATVNSVIGALFGYASGGRDVLFGGAGNDRLIGGVGSDDLDGGDGDDSLFGDTDTYYAPGNLAWIPGEFHDADMLEGGAGSDFLLGGGGADALTGGAGNDTICGDQYTTEASWIPVQYHGDDWIDGGDGDDTLRGDGGNDTLYSGFGVNVLDGGIGNDVLTAQGAHDQLFGGEGADVLVAVGWDATLDGGNGIDLYTVPTSATIAGFNAEDSAQWLVDSDTVIIGRDSSDPDLVYLKSSGGAAITFNDMFSQVTSGVVGLSKIAFAGGDEWTGEELFARAVSRPTDGDDEVIGFRTDDVLVGLGGDDKLSGAGGRDEFTGGTGNDTIVNEDGGSSILNYGAGDGFDVAYLGEMLPATNVIQLGVGIDPASVVIRAPSASDATADLRLSINNDPSTGLLVHSAIDTGGPSSNDLIDRVEFSDGSVWDQEEIRRRLTLPTEGNDNIHALWTSSAPLLGLAGDDVLYGTSGNDTLDGGTGNDVLRGGAGNDVFAGGQGDDTLSDGVGYGTSDDLYRFNRGDGRDTISDDVGNDAVEFGPGIAPSEVRLLLSSYGTLSFVLATGERVDVANAVDSSYSAKAKGVEVIRFTGGTSWGWAQIEQQLAVGQTGTADADSLVGYGNSNEVLSGAAGNDSISGGAGDDVLDGGSGADQLAGDSGNDVFQFGRGDGQDMIQEYSTQLGETNTLQFKADVAPSDVVVGRNYTQLTMSIASTSDKITAAWFFASDSGPNVNPTRCPLQRVEFADGTVWTQLDFSPVPERLDGTAGADLLRGYGGDDQLFGLGGNDTLDGGVGADIMVGGAGNDSYFVDRAADVVTEAAGEGVDTVNSLVTTTLGANLENLTLIGTSAISGTGNASVNTLRGNSGDNFLDGGAGADTMIGGAGNDTYVVDATADVVTELAGEGVDTVRVGFTWTLGAEFENVTLTGNAAINATGNVQANTLMGNAAANILTGGAGNDVLDGGAGTDALIGGKGNDTYVVDTASDVVTELAGEGTDTIQAAVAWTLAAEFENLTLIGSAPIDATGNAQANTLIGNSGANRIDGGAGADVMMGGADNDAYVVDVAGDTVTETSNEGTDTVESRVAWTLGANVENLTLTGSAPINGTGNALANVIAGNSAANRLDGGAGADAMSGGAGNDTFVVDDVGDTVVEAANAGTDGVEASLTWVLSSTVENLTLTGTLAIDGTGNALSNTLRGNSGDNTLNGGGEADTLSGGAGNDTYLVNVATDLVTELVGEGIDTVKSAVTWTLGAELENLTLTGTGATNGTGNSLDNTLTGNSAANRLDGGAGNDTLSGGAGDDTLVGGAGDDTYVVDVATDVVTEAASEGTDKVKSSVAWTLGANLESLQLIGSAAINGSGNSLANTLTGNTAANRLDGGAGTDTMSGGAGDDTYVVDDAADSVVEGSNAGTDAVESSVAWTLGANLENLTLTGSSSINGAGNSLANTLTGNSGANRLDGGGGADTMTGGAGNDIYVADDVGDAVTEAANAGIDTVEAAVSWVLSSGVDNLTLTGTLAIDGTGNALANMLRGNSGDNTLNGGGEADTLIGGAGNDVYLVNVATDVVTELAGEGTDTVKSAVTWVLGAELDDLTLTGTAAINGTGNSLDNSLTGNAAANQLNGGAGNDVLSGGAGGDMLIGGAGNDTFVVDAATDVVAEAINEGTDKVKSAVSWTLGANFENLILTGTAAISGSGNSLANALTGNAADNTLAGFDGNDIYDGAGGADYFTDASLASNDTYQWGIGSGLDHLRESGGALDHVDLFAGVTKAQLQFARSGNDLELTINGQADKLTIDNWYVSTANQVEEFRLSDGSKVLASEVQSLLSAMAAFSAPPAGAASWGCVRDYQIRHGPNLTMPAWK